MPFADCSPHLMHRCSSALALAMANPPSSTHPMALARKFHCVWMCSCVEVWPGHALNIKRYRNSGSVWIGLNVFWFGEAFENDGIFFSLALKLSKYGIRVGQLFRVAIGGLPIPLIEKCVQKVLPKNGINCYCHIKQ